VEVAVRLAEALVAVVDAWRPALREIHVGVPRAATEIATAQGNAIKMINQIKSNQSQQ